MPWLFGRLTYLTHRIYICFTYSGRIARLLDLLDRDPAAFFQSDEASEPDTLSPYIACCTHARIAAVVIHAWTGGDGHSRPNTTS